MGGGPDKEVLLFLYSDEDSDYQSLIDPIVTRFPYVEVILFQAKTHHSVPERLWQRATVLVTLFVLPSKPDLVPRLKWIQLASAGVDHILEHPIFGESRISITTASGIHTPAISEWVLLTSLSVSKKFPIILTNQAKHEWDPRGIGLMKRRDWGCRTVGIVGYGSIGRQVARVFKSMSCQILAFTASPHTTPESRQDDGYIIPGTGDPDGTLPDAWFSGKEKSGLHEFLSSGLDLLVISLPLTSATRGMFSTEEFQVLYKASLERVRNDPAIQLDKEEILPEGEGCIVSNPARGAIIDQPALVRALRQGKLQGAALDVTDPEPLPESSEMWDLPNVVITPHLSAHFAGYMKRVFDIVDCNLERREKGEKMVNVVNRNRGY